ncbi:PDxFFG protein [Mycoplasma miroungirhinis]|uniref:PDxFFG protein n=1 Tax=Mycoplasma miroungirhinis TaxID=754516 RepID=A0A6M4JHE6_9MOLU|nr:PDxFFG protein [Mycoplasma miroungirhinis]QJR43881.1 PDxFFG protein [Mycoplasma miroungirhinis]
MKNKQPNNNLKKSFNWRTVVWPKYVISLATIALASAITIGILKYNSTLSNLQEGFENNLLKNKFVDPKVGAKLTFVNSDKNRDIAAFDPAKGENGQVFYKDKWIEYNDFLKQYYEKNHAMPFLNIKYGMFDFYNEYIEAVSAKDFYEFTQWFMHNVSWGPEIITLKEFSIVKGVELQGNNITLGSHSNQDKEYTTIKFFPDAFFGSIPLHSTLSGPGNASDSLLYRINKKLLTFPELQQFLDNVNEYNSFTNISNETVKQQTFRTISDKRNLIGKEVFVVKGDFKEKLTKEAYSSIEKIRLESKSDYISLVYANSEQEAKEKFAEYVKKYSSTDKFDTLKNYKNFTFEKKKIINVLKREDDISLNLGFSDKRLTIIFEDGKNLILFNDIESVEYKEEKDNDSNYVKYQNVESVEQGLDHNKKAFSNLSSDISSIFTKSLSKNSYLTKEDFNKFENYVRDLDKSKEIQDLIISNNKLIQKSGQKYKTELQLYKEDKQKSIEKLAELDKELKAKQAQKVELEAAISSETDDQAKENKNYELYKLAIEIENINLKIYQFTDAQKLSEDKITELNSLIPTDEQVAEAHKNIIELSKQDKDLNLETKKQEILKILKKGLFEPEQLKALIGLYKLNSVVVESEFNKDKNDFASIDEKVEYIKKLHNFIINYRPQYKQYNEILSGDIYAQLQKEDDKYILYSADLGYTPIQLIAVDELLKLSKDYQINWREYSNLNGFMRSQKDDNPKGFYLYSKNIHSIENDFSTEDLTIKKYENYQELVKDVDNYLNNEIKKPEDTQIQDRYSNIRRQLTEEKAKTDELFKDPSTVTDATTKAAIISLQKAFSIAKKQKLAIDQEKQIQTKENTEQNKVQEIVKSYKDNPELIQKEKEIKDKISKTNLDDLFSEFQKEQEKVTDLTEEYNEDIQALIRIITLKSFVDYTDDKGEKSLYKEIENIIINDDVLSTHIDSFKKAMDNIDNLRQTVQESRDTYKIKLSIILKNIYAIFSKIATINSNLQADYDDYAKIRSNLYDQKINEIIKSISDADFSDPKFNVYMEQLIEKSNNEIETFNIENENFNKNLTQTLTNFKNSLDYFRELDKTYSTNNLSEVITDYYSIVSNPIFKKLGNYGDSEGQERKFIGTLFNFIISYQHKKYEKYTNLIEEQEKEIENLKEQLDDEKISEAKKIEIQKEIVNLQNQIHLNKDLASSTHYEDGDYYSELANIQELADAWEYEDFEESGEFEYDFEDQDLADRNKTLIDKMNADVTKYTRSRDRLYDSIKEYNNQPAKLIESLYTKADLFEKSNQKYNEAIEAAAKAAKEVKRVYTRQSILLDSLFQDKGQEISNNNPLVVAKSKIDLLNKLTKLGIVKNDTDVNEFAKHYIFNVELNDIKKENTTLTFTLKNIQKRNGEIVTSQDASTYLNTKFIKFKVDANVSDAVGDTTLEQVRELLDVAGYKAVIQPYSIKEEGSKIIIDDNGETKTVPTYSIFVEAYDGFTKTLLNKVPWVGEYLEGEHLVTNLNEKGEFEYKLEKGSYLGLDPDSRIGLWAVLAMNDPNFKGIAVDFLKFVAAHEYGHHMTLNAAQDLGDKGQKPLYGSALVPGSTPNINNYYSRNVLDLYLKARTHLGLNSSPLLNEPNVVSENNEGEYLLYNQPKKNEQGEIVINKDTVESGNDIWGYKVGSSDLKNAMENSKRRFLQTYEGLVKATEERRKENGINNKEDQKWLQVFDLWLMNTLDQNSGTLNPTKYSDDQFPVKYMIKDKDGKLKFTKASLDMLSGILKDGQGNFIQFEDRSGELVPKIVEGSWDSDSKEYNNISKILVFNKDGSPVINVPLNVDFNNHNEDENPYDQTGERNANITKKYINDKIKEIEDTIKSLIVKEFSINGWDFSTTNTSIEPKTIIAYPSYAEIFTSANKNYNLSILKPYIDHLQSRNRETATITPEYIVAKYYADDGTVLRDRIHHIGDSKIRDVLQEDFYLNPFEEKGKDNTTFTDILISMYLAEGETYPTLAAGAKQVLWLDKDTQYLPNVKLENAFTDGFLIDTFNKQTLKQINQLPLLNWYGPYTRSLIGIDIKNNSYLTVNANDEIVSENPQVPGYPAFWEMKSLKINKNTLAKDPLNSLFDSYYLLKDNKKLFDFDLKFLNYNDFFNFASVDTLRAKLDSQAKVVNWDIDYVESKFDIDKFIKGLKLALSLDNSLSTSDKLKLNKLLRDNNRQEIANEIMRRFTESKLALFIKDIPLSTIKQKIEENKDNQLRYAWIFDKDLGYATFKSEDVVVGKDNLDESKWEMPVQQLLNTYDEFAKENNVSLDKFSLFDDLILDNKTQMYSTQLLYNFRLSKFGMDSILLSFTKGITKKLKPTEDVVNYFKTKTERKFNEFFSDYTYSFAEVINRDNLQITYSPSTSEFRNLPSFITNVSEATTGLEYVVDGQPTAKWKDALIQFKGESKHTIQNTIVDYEQKLDNELKLRANKLNLDYRPNDMANVDNFSSDQNKNSNYLGQFKSINNGWFKDRWYRDMLNFRLYDDEGIPIVDDTIRIKDLEGNVVNNRAKAYWEYYIQSQGVGHRNISNIWRHTDKDAVAMFGYLNAEDAKKVNYLVFEDIQTHERKTLKINKEFSSNMFYYKTQNINNENDINARHWLKDEAYDYTDSNGYHKGTGFVAWVSDYAIMSNYQNKLLEPNHEYKIYFSDSEAGNITLKMDLGKNQSVSENGKTFSQAPTSIYLKEIDGQQVPVLHVGVQFNGTK